MKIRIALLMSIVIAVTFMPVMTFADTAIADNPDYDTLAFTADIHNQKTDNGLNRLNSWIPKVAAKEGDMLELVGTCGDTGSAYAESSNVFWKEVKRVFDAIDGSEYVKNGGVHITGNHEYDNGKLASTSNDTTARLKGIGGVITDDDYTIFCFGPTSKTWEFTDANISVLKNYLATYSSDKPLIIMSHYPAHSLPVVSETKNWDKVIDTINEYAEGKTIIFLWGHNHTAHDHDSHYDKVYTAGDTIGGKTIKFVYTAAGCMSDGDDYFWSDTSIKAKGIIISIDTVTGKVTIKHYDKNGNVVVEKVVKEGKEPTPPTPVNPVNPVNPGPVGPVAPTEPDKPGSEHEHNYVYTVIAEPGLLTNGVAGYICECGEALKYIDLPGYSESHLKSLKIKKSKNGFTVKWKKQSKKNQKEFSGYQIAYSTKKSMKNAKYVYAKKAASSKLIKAAKKQYYVKVRTYKTVDGCRFYADWSKVKIVKK